jgi:hypothetical protein
MVIHINIKIIFGLLNLKEIILVSLKMDILTSSLYELKDKNSGVLNIMKLRFNMKFKRLITCNKYYEIEI